MVDTTRTDSTPQRDEEDRPNRPFCTICGDVIACMHKPDAIVLAAWEQETYRNVRKEAK
jgi:hypothetical protein